MFINQKNIFDTKQVTNMISGLILSIFTCLIVTSSINDVKKLIFSNHNNSSFFKECGIYINSQIMIELNGNNKRKLENQDSGLQVLNIQPMGFAFNPFEDFMNLMMNDIRQFEHDPLFDIIDEDEIPNLEKRQLNSNPLARNNKNQGKYTFEFKKLLFLFYNCRCKIRSCN